MYTFSRTVLLGCLVLSPWVSADTLLIDRANQAESAALPKRGALMSAVESEFGAPEQKFDAVGDPPIARWKYARFTVYFENDHVVHAVLNRASPNEKGPKPAQ